jgi:hypothetical protein
MPPKRTIDSSDSIVEELQVEKQYGKNLWKIILIKENFFDNDSVDYNQKRNIQKKKNPLLSFGPQGDVNSLIRKIKPTNFELTGKQTKNNYNPNKKPQKSNLKVH